MGIGMLRRHRTRTAKELGPDARPLESDKVPEKAPEKKDKKPPKKEA